MTEIAKSLPGPNSMAALIDQEIRTVPRVAKEIRAVRRRYSQHLRQAPAEYLLYVAKALVLYYDRRGVPYELIACHREAFALLNQERLEELGSGMNNWWSVDSFGRVLSGPAWLKGLIGDPVIHKWAKSNDLWWRRAALVSTIALNLKASGGMGDAARTLAVCRMLAGDSEDMVIKALSWSLRCLVPHDPPRVRQFLEEYDEHLAARVKREVRNKLATGLKNPRRKK